VCTKQHDRTGTRLNREMGPRDDVCVMPHFCIGPRSVGGQGLISAMGTDQHGGFRVHLGWEVGLVMSHVRIHVAAPEPASVWRWALR
jgi:hypothetical protein